MVEPDHFGYHFRRFLCSYGSGSGGAQAGLSTSFDLLPDQELLALQAGAAVTLADDVIHLQWFVRDVNGLDRTITVATLMVGQIQERTVPFDSVQIAWLDDQEQATADLACRDIERHLAQRSSAAGDSARSRRTNTQKRRRR